MADLMVAGHPLGGEAAGRRGAPDGPPGVTVTILPDGRQTLVLARRDGARELMDATAKRGLALPAPGRATLTRDLALVATGPGQWIAFEADRNPLASALLKPLAPLCTLVRADDGRVLVAVSGPSAREALAKMLAIDLHPRVFAPGQAAATRAGDIAVLAWQTDAEPRFVLAVPRSLAGSFWAWLMASAAPAGCVVAGAAV